MLHLGFSEIIKIIFAIIVGLTVHEWAHALTALKLGDPTPRKTGRLTLNPLKHIDPIGFILLIVAGFGWAKPVQIDHAYLQYPKRDDILISLAGPLSNLALAFIVTALFKLTLLIMPFASETILQEIIITFTWFIYINLGLFIFNMIPLPPLDGSHVLLNLFPEKYQKMVYSYFRYSSLLFFGIIIFENVTKTSIIPLSALIKSLFNILLTIMHIGA
jgi:Zn-dependent protease